MSQYANLKAAIAANVYQNHNNEVTANMVKAAMNAMVDSLGAGYQYMGIAVLTPTPTNPGTPDQRVFYITAQPGTYTNFSGLVVNDGEVAILKWDTAWHKEVTGAATAAKLTELGQEVESTNFEINDVAQKLTKEIPSSLFELKPYILLDTNKFNTITTDGVHACLPVTEGEVYYLSVNASRYGRFAFATSDEATAGGDIPLVPGTSAITMLRIGDFYKVVIPSGCVYLLFNAGDFYKPQLYKTIDIHLASEKNIGDFTIVDEQGNILALFDKGHFRTKRFDSSFAPKITRNIYGNTFSICDENGNAILSLANGHIFTKNFDSSNISVEEKLPYQRENIHFSVKVNVNMLKDPQVSANLTDSYVEYEDNGVLMLPENYSPSGKPTRLVIACHGAGGGVDDHDSQTEQQTAYKYLVANGYAVMDMAGMPSDWVETWWTDYDDYGLPADKKQYVKVNNMGCPLTMECYIKGYQWVIDNYNIATDGVLIAGGSMGGLSSTNLVLCGRLPVLAHGILAPVLDTYNQAFLHPWTSGVAKYALSKLYGFSVENNDFVYDAAKVCGYNPIINGMQSYSLSGRVTSVGTYNFSTKQLNNEDVVEYKNYPCPLKIWHCENDGTVNIAISERQVSAIKNGGGMAWIRKFATGGHAPDTAGNIVSSPLGNTILKGQSVGAIYPAIEELYMYFNRFNQK